MTTRSSLPRSSASPAPPTADPSDVSEAAEFLEWLADDHFTFIGACDEAGGVALGTVRRRGVPAGLPGKDADPDVLTLTKVLERSTVHRAVPLDFVGVKRFDASGSDHRRPFEHLRERQDVGICASLPEGPPARHGLRTIPDATPPVRRRRR